MGPKTTFPSQCLACGSRHWVRVPGHNQSKIGIPAGGLSWVPVTRFLCTECGRIEQWVESAEARERLVGKYSGGGSGPPASPLSRAAGGRATTGTRTVSLGCVVALLATAVVLPFLLLIVLAVFWLAADGPPQPHAPVGEPPAAESAAGIWIRSAE